MNFSIIILNQSISAIENYVTWIPIALLCILILRLIMKTLKNIEKRFDTSNYEFTRPLLQIGKTRKVIELMKDELGGKIMTEFVVLRPRIYSHLIDDGTDDKKAEGTKKCVIKCRLKFSYYKYCLLNNEIILESQQRF